MSSNSASKNDLRQKIEKMDRELEQVQSEKQEKHREMKRLRLRLLGSHPEDEKDSSKGDFIFPGRQGDSDFGVLMDLVTFSSQDKCWIEALGLVIEKSLLHRICLDEQTAKRILQANRNRRAFTIWSVVT